MQKKYVVRLTEEERQACKEVIKKLKGTSEKVRRAQILLKADADGPNWTDQRIAEAFSCRTKTVENIRKAMNKSEPALGLLKDFPYTVYESKIGDDDVVLFYTDGIYEVENSAGELFGKERLYRSVHNQLALHPDRLLEGIINDINDIN